MSLATIFAEVKTLSLEDQRALNSLLVANIRSALKHKAVMTSIEFRAGDIVKFDGKTRGPIFIKINSFSRDRTKIKGVQLNRGWKTQPGVQWTVGATVVKASTVAEAEANKF
jgi:hypothetical protein